MSWKVLLGILFLFLGVVIASLHNYAVETYVLKESYVRHSQFQVSGYFKKGDKLFFDIIPGDEWALWSDWIMTDVVPDYVDVKIQVEINNTFNEKTVIDVIYILYAYGEEASLVPFAAYINSTTGGLKNVTKSDSVGMIEGIVETEGDYSACLLTPEFLYEQNLPPKTISLIRYEKTLKYKYRQVAPSGFFLIILSLFIFLYNFIVGKKPKLKRRITSLSIGGKPQNALFPFLRVQAPLFCIFLLKIPGIVYETCNLRADLLRLEFRLL